MKHTLNVSRIETLTQRIRLLELLPSDPDTFPKYQAGAHLKFDLGPLGERSYSLIDWPVASDALAIAVQLEEPGTGGSKAMHALSEGAEINVSGPKNDFQLGDHDGPAILLAGGIGVTPLISMATALQTEDRAFSFYYAGRSQSQMAFVEPLQKAFGSHMILCPDDTAPIDLEAIAGQSTADAHFYICGPKGMIDAARQTIESAGYDAGQIHIELFSEAEATEGDRAFEVELSSNGEVVTVAADQTIIEALEAAGHDVIYDCQRGDCGICQTDVISGELDHRDVVLSESERESGKVMQICVSRAKSPRLVLDL